MLKTQHVYSQTSRSLFLSFSLSPLSFSLFRSFLVRFRLVSRSCPGTIRTRISVVFRRHVAPRPSWSFQVRFAISLYLGRFVSDSDVGQCFPRSRGLCHSKTRSIVFARDLSDGIRTRLSRLLLLGRGRELCRHLDRAPVAASCISFSPHKLSRFQSNLDFGSVQKTHTVRGFPEHFRSSKAGHSLDHSQTPTEL